MRSCRRRSDLLQLLSVGLSARAAGKVGTGLKDLELLVELALPASERERR